MIEFELSDIKRVMLKTLEDAPTGIPLLDARYDKQRETGVTRYYYRLFYLLAQELKPGLTVELGAWQGTAAAHFAAGWPDGIVATIDHHTDPGDEVHKAKTLEVAQRFPNLFYFQGYTWDKVHEVRDLGRPIDILFIDAWHQYDYFKRDWEDYSPLLADTALVICDDILDGDGPVIAGMRRFWDELDYEKFLDGRMHPGYPIGFLKYIRDVDL